VIAVIDTRKDDKAIEDQLKRKMVAVLNEGGGFIFLAELYVDIIKGIPPERLYQCK